MDLIIPEIRDKESHRSYARRALRINIMTLRLKPGAALNEGELAEVFYMSRTPIHEAITSLKDEWLVEIFPQRGTKVSRIDPSLVKEGYNLRLLLEGDLLRDEAGKLSREQQHQLLDNLRLQEQMLLDDPENVDQFIHLDDEFHRIMYYSGGRSHTWRAIRGVVSHYDRLRYLDALDGKANKERVIRQHRQFCDYLVMGLPEGLETRQLMVEHLTSFRGNLLDTIEEHPDYFTLQV